MFLLAVTIYTKLDAFTLMVCPSLTFGCDRAILAFCDRNKRLNLKNQL
ncbi:hypothetical protein VB714_25485 [Spirulina sp. 06S082]|nr:hypothetical protein [Spirulina sp. 06S082]